MRVSRTGLLFGAGLLLGIGLLLTSCGFRLAGSVELPATLTLVQLETSGSPHSEFYHDLRRRLQAAGTRLSDEAAAAAPTIRILEDGYSERVLTVSARNVPTAYEITYSVRVAVSSGGRELLAAESHQLSRDYSFDQNALLAKERERDALVEALAHDLAEVILRRLASL